jgi:hypothetical protein
VTAVSDRHTSDTIRRSPTFEDAQASASGIRLGAIGWFLVPVSLALLIFAHGCHTGDHDDEPSLGPPVQEMEPPR